MVRTMIAYIKTNPEKLEERPSTCGFCGQRNKNRHCNNCGTTNPGEPLKLRKKENKDAPRQQDSST